MNKAMKTEKTATGLDRFQNEKGFTRWFDLLRPVLAEREENKAGVNVEPSAPPKDDETDSLSRSSTPQNTPV